jgi:large subunit ribosomal protein L15
MKRIGRGIGSGKGGHTVGRGSKGQKSRGHIGPFFEGTKIKKSLIKRLPLLRGKGKLTPGNKPLIINLKYLNLFSANDEVTLATLEKHGLIVKKDLGPKGVKILGDGELKVALVVKLPVSKGAQKKIEKAGGKVEK